MRAIAADPFGEGMRPFQRARLHVLGGALTVESVHAPLLQLAVEAFGGLPRHRLAHRQQRFRMTLVHTEHPAAWRLDGEPPRPVLSSGDGLLCATIDAGNFAVVDNASARALVCISRDMLRYPYHARYELVELAVVTLAARVQTLVPLHGACLGTDGLGLLLMGPSGAGKSTLSLHALTAGMQLMSEDSVFVATENLEAVGVPNYLHVQESALRFMQNVGMLEQIRRSPVISRRSGARKYEVDLRKLGAPIARVPLRLAATLFLSNRAAGRGRALRALERKALLVRLRDEQPYAAGQPGWRAFERRIVGVPAYELRRTQHPDIAVEQLRELLDAVQRA